MKVQELIENDNFKPILSTLQWIKRTNEIIEIHRKENDELAIKQYERKRNEFIEDLYGLLAGIELDLDFGVRAK